MESCEAASAHGDGKWSLAKLRARTGTESLVLRRLGCTRERKTSSCEASAAHGDGKWSLATAGARRGTESLVLRSCQHAGRRITLSCEGQGAHGDGIVGLAKLPARRGTENVILRSFGCAGERKVESCEASGAHAPYATSPDRPSAPLLLSRAPHRRRYVSIRVVRLQRGWQRRPQIAISPRKKRTPSFLLARLY